MVSEIDLIKYMLSQPLITGRIGKWSFALSKFTLVYFPYKSIKEQVLANFMAYHPTLEIKPVKDVELGIYEVERWPWVLMFTLAERIPLGLG